MPIVDYLLLTPLDEEWRTVRNVLCPVPENVTERPIDQITYYLWKQRVDRPPHTVGDYLIVGTKMSRKTPGESLASVITKDSVRQWKPGRVVLLGIAGSLERQRLQLGDVVVSEEIYGYEVEDAIGKGFHFRATFNQAGALDYDRVRAFRDDPVAYPKWQEECLEAAPAAGLDGVVRLPELHLEAIASGNKVVKSVAFGRKLKREINSKISAVEMEARGLYQALHQDVSRTDALMIRGISDYSDGRKTDLEKSSKDGWRKFCAANAARLLRAIWQRGPVPPLSPGYELNLTMGDHTRFRQPGVPNIAIKQVGAQNVAFPDLIHRSNSNPELYLEVTARLASGDPSPKFQGLCVVESPKREVIQPYKLFEGGVMFVLPASMWGLSVELLLSFQVSVDEIKVVCRDDFQRSSEATLKR